MYFAITDYFVIFQAADGTRATSPSSASVTSTSGAQSVNAAALAALGPLGQLLGASPFLGAAFQNPANLQQHLQHLAMFQQQQGTAQLPPQAQFFLQNQVKFF